MNETCSHRDGALDVRIDAVVLGDVLVELVCTDCGASARWEVRREQLTGGEARL